MLKNDRLLNSPSLVQRSTTYAETGERPRSNSTLAAEIRHSIGDLFPVDESQVNDRATFWILLAYVYGQMGIRAMGKRRGSELV